MCHTELGQHRRRRSGRAVPHSGTAPTQEARAQEAHALGTSQDNTMDITLQHGRSGGPGRIAAGIVSDRRTSNRARTTQRNTTSNHLRNKILSHTHLARTCLAHTGIACALLSFAFQMSAQSWYLDCKCVLFLVTLHMIAYCLHITDGCISRVHACIVFALRMSVFESPCGGSANACTYGICSADSCLAY